MGHRWVRTNQPRVGRLGTITILRLRSFVDLQHNTLIITHNCQKCGQWMTMAYSDILIHTGLTPPKEHYDLVTCEEIMINKILTQ